VLLLLGIVLVVAFAAFGFFWHLLWLGVLVGLLVLVGRLAVIGLDPNSPAGRLNIGVLNALGRYLLEVRERARHRTRRVGTGGVEVVEVTNIVAADRAAQPTPAGASTSTMTEQKTEQALVMAKQGMTRAAIAEQLGVSRSTVSRHLRRRRSPNKRMSKQRRATG
jgi:DNA-binding CsgD family transcriptional regulator